jgi:hypothetical protein
MPSIKTVDEAILSLPKTEQVIVKRLRALAQECLPKAIEESKYGWGVPFYSHHRLICFIWAPSLYWGKDQKVLDKNLEKGVTLGFCQGNRMSNEDGVLKSEGRKQVYCMYFKLLSEIDDEQIRALLYEAELVDENFKKKKALRTIK